MADRLAMGATLVIALGLLSATSGEVATVYYVSSEGLDTNDGKSPETAWRTIGRVNAAHLEPGDVIRLRRGDIWREQLRPCSGSEAGVITYSAYAEGPKPLLLGSIAKNAPEDWRDEGNNIWSTAEPRAGGPELLPNSDFAEGDSHWILYTENEAAAAGRVAISGDAVAPRSYRIDCARPGTRGSHIQFFTSPVRVEDGKLYRLSFRARCTKPFHLQSPTLMSTGPPWTGYSAEPPLRKRIDTTWTTYAHYYRANVSAHDARLTFFLGAAVPEGASFEIADVSFAEYEGKPLPADVGNIILDHEAACGVKVWEESDLDAPGEFWYDENRQIVKMYSVECPATHYSAVECAVRAHIVDQSNTSYVIYENLALKYGAAHGIGGGNTHHIVVRDCDLAYIGGGDQRGGDGTVRFGNGVEFWGNAHDSLVERCRLWEIYDAALTNQNNGPNVEQYNIVYRSNIIWNCEYSFEYWNRPENSLTHNVRFESNTCVNAGHGWGHNQRADPSGRHLCFYASPAPARDITVRNNVFFEAESNALYAPGWPEEAIASLRMDNNCWLQAAGTMILLQDRPYTMPQFSEYQAEQAKEPNSIVADPLLADAANGDFRLTEGSPCIDAGADVGLNADFDGVTIPQGAGPDIGAYEFRL